MFARSRRPSAAMVVAIAAFVMAVTGTAVAGPLKTLIDGSSISKHSIPGNRLINHTLTGEQINLSKLGTVPNAQRLGGQPAAGYLNASTLLRWSFKMNKGNPAHTFAFGPLKFSATCAADGGNTNAELLVKTTESGTYVSWDTEGEPMSGQSAIISPTSKPYLVLEQDSNVADDGNSSGFEAFDPAGRVAIFSTAETLGVAINTPGADCRFFGYLVTDA